MDVEPPLMPTSTEPVTAGKADVMHELIPLSDAYECPAIGNCSGIARTLSSLKTHRIQLNGGIGS